MMIWHPGMSAFCEVANDLRVFSPCSEAPVDMTGDLSSVEVMEKEDAVFTCELSKPAPVTWQINGKVRVHRTLVHACTFDWVRCQADHLLGCSNDVLKFGEVQPCFAVGNVLMTMASHF